MKPTSRYRVFLRIAFVATGVSVGTARSLGAQLLTDDQLYRAAYDAHGAVDYVNTAIFLYAYIQRNPVVLTNEPARNAEVRSVYQWAVREIQNALQRGKADRARVEQLERGKSGLGSSSQGLGTAPPRLTPPSAPHTGGAGRPGAAIMTTRSLSVDGAWTIEMHSDASGTNYTGRVQLEIEGGAVTGTINIAGVGVRAVRGLVAAVGDSVDFVRDTGLETIQHFRVARSGTQLGGRFWNVGRYADSGSVVLRR